MATLDKKIPHREGLALSLKDFPFLAAYGLGFILLHQAAIPWSGPGFFSLWYPAAGWRFAALWVKGARFTPWLAIVETLMDTATGAIPISGPNVVLEAWSALRPAMAYGITLTVVRFAVTKSNGPLAAPPMPFGLAAVTGPVIGALFIIPLAILRPDLPGPGIHTDLMISLTDYVIGDLLGILVLSPPMIWLAGAISSGDRLAPALPRLRPISQNTVILAVSLLITIFLLKAGMGLQPLPALLAAAWIGLRHGRKAAWLAIIVIVALFLPYTAQPLSPIVRLETHLGIAAIVIVAWLSGSYTDAQTLARAELDKRNRLLFQAERLKTLRAMSVAVIHEISQPLSTLAIEANHLRGRTQSLDEDIVRSASLVDQKAQTLSELVRRLRRFGGRDADEPSKIQVAQLITTISQMMQPELQERGCLLKVNSIDASFFIRGQEVELSQAIVNLLRNAMTATTDGTISLAAHRDGEEIHIAVSNARQNIPTPATSAGFSGMGVGLIIARTIIEAHGGSLSRHDDPTNVKFVIRLAEAGVL